MQNLLEKYPTVTLNKKKIMQIKYWSSYLCLKKTVNNLAGCSKNRSIVMKVIKIHKTDMILKTKP